MSESRMLISVSDLRRHLDDDNWCIVDVRHDLFDTGYGEREYAVGHVPGAVFAGIDQDLSGAKTGTNGRHPLPARDDLVETFRAWGINDNTQIVGYDAQSGQFAVRLWWLARWLGHSKVALLDGGWPKWLAETQMSSTDVPRRAMSAGPPQAHRVPPRGAGAQRPGANAFSRGTFNARPSLVPLAKVDDVLASIGTGDQLLLDARTPERYRGEHEPIDPVAGHIPGALNRPWQQNVNADQTFRPAHELRAEFNSLLGNRSPGEMTHQCGSGVTACHNVFAMELAGLPGSSLYSGSWSEWIADPARPIATGAKP